MLTATEPESLDPVRLLQEIRFAQQSLIDIATHGVLVQAAPSPRPDVDAFLAGLSTAWKDGDPPQIAEAPHRVTIFGVV